MQSKAIILLSIMLSGFNVFGQQPPQYSQFVFNNFLINPAVGGSGDYIDFKLGYRTQWIGFGAAPKTYLFSIHSPLKNKGAEPRQFGERNHHAIGGYALKDETGPISNISGYLSYSYHVRLSYHLRASLGLFGGVKQYQFNPAGLTTGVPDADLVSINAIAPDAAAGVWVYSKKYFAGFSAHQLIPLPIGGTPNTLKMHYFLTGGYKIPVKKLDSEIIPSAHIKFGLLTPVTFDLNIKFNYQDILWAGLSYRKVDAIIGIAGFNISNYIQVGYAYDFTLSKLRKYSSNTHEIIISARFKPKKRVQDFKCPDWG